MPELPEVETVCRGLRKALKGQRIRRVEQRRADLREALPADLAARLQGRRIEDVRRRAKYILIRLDSGETLLMHLGMSGRLLIEEGPSAAALPGPHDHLVFGFDNGARLCFHDPRRFGFCDLVARGGLASHKALRHLGVEPLSPSFTPAFLARLFYGKKLSIKDALMDQRRIAGIGNIYASEALYVAGIDPRRPAGACAKQDLVALVRAVRLVLRAAIRAGGSSLRDYRRADGERGMFQLRFAVYGREGKPCASCACDLEKTGGVRRITQGGRSSFYCPERQL